MRRCFITASTLFATFGALATPALAADARPWTQAAFKQAVDLHDGPNQAIGWLPDQRTFGACQTTCASSLSNHEVTCYVGKASASGKVQRARKVSARSFLKRKLLATNGPETRTFGRYTVAIDSTYDEQGMQCQWALNLSDGVRTAVLASGSGECFGPAAPTVSVSPDLRTLGVFVAYEGHHGCGDTQAYVVGIPEAFERALPPAFTKDSLRRAVGNIDDAIEQGVDTVTTAAGWTADGTFGACRWAVPDRVSSFRIECRAGTPTDDGEVTALALTKRSDWLNKDMLPTAKGAKSLTIDGAKLGFSRSLWRNRCTWQLWAKKGDRKEVLARGKGECFDYTRPSMYLSPDGNALAVHTAYYGDHDSGETQGVVLAIHKALAKAFGQTLR